MHKVLALLIHLKSHSIDKPIRSIEDQHTGLINAHALLDRVEKRGKAIIIQLRCAAHCISTICSGPKCRSTRSTMSLRQKDTRHIRSIHTIGGADALHGLHAVIRARSAVLLTSGSSPSGRTRGSHEGGRGGRVAQVAARPVLLRREHLDV